MNTDQIAAEAAEKVLREALPEEWRGYREPLLIRVSAIIKDAIEKARGIKTTEYAKWWDDHVAAVRSSHAAHASEQFAAEEMEQLARTFHNVYERLAPDFGYETNKETRDFDPTTLNGRLMIAVCGEILKYHLPRAAGASEQRMKSPKPGQERERNMNPNIADYTTRTAYQRAYREANRKAINERRQRWREARKTRRSEPSVAVRSGTEREVSSVHGNAG